MTLPAAAIAAVICAASLLVIWFERPDGQEEMDRYGSALANTLANTTADALLNTEQITLTVIANRLTALEEIDGIAFFGPSDSMMAMSGIQPSSISYVAEATIDETLSGIVSVTLNQGICATVAVDAGLAVANYCAADPGCYSNGYSVRRAGQSFAAHRSGACGARQAACLSADSKTA